jgi:hypothetical protein
MQDYTFTVKAVWDPEAQVWVADSDDVPGLAAEAETSEKLNEKLGSLIPELLELNGVRPETEIEVIIHYYREERISVPIAA